MKKILISGGTGLIGLSLARGLQDKGYQPALLSRSGKPAAGFQTFYWDPYKGVIDKEALDHAEGLIHLAGVNLGAKRWTARRKKQIRDSRVHTAEFLFRTFENSPEKPRVYITASAIGYYGTRTTDKVFTEEDPAHPDFLGKVCEGWEGVADRFRDAGIRQVRIRSGVVLSGQGGALSKLSLPVRYGLGAPLGSGKQFMPWIHILDLVGIFIHALEQPEMTGAYNAVAPEHVTNRDLTRSLARVLRRPQFLPGIPSVLLKMILGEMSGMLLEGSRVSANKTLQSGYQFRFPQLLRALDDLMAGSS